MSETTKIANAAEQRELRYDPQRMLSLPEPSADNPVTRALYHYGRGEAFAALHPKMLALAAEQTNGTHTYFVPPEHTAKARAAIGPKPWICAAQAVILESDATKARAMARTYTREEYLEKITLIRGALEPHERHRVVSLHALALRIEISEQILSNRVALFGDRAPKASRG